jgi:hypothetical protein
VRTDLRAALRAAFGDHLRLIDVGDAQAMRARVQAVHDMSAAGHEPGALQAIGLVETGGRSAVLEIGEAPSALAVGTLQAFVDRFIEQGGAHDVDYVHGDDVLERLGRQAGSAGFHLPGLGKHELLERVVRGGPLPRKTFSMGEAHEKRYYVEARRIR